MAPKIVAKNTANKGAAIIIMGHWLIIDISPKISSSSTEPYSE